MYFVSVLDCDVDMTQHKTYQNAINLGHSKIKKLTVINCTIDFALYINGS